VRWPVSLRNSNTVDIVCKALPGDPGKLVLYVVDDGSIDDQLERYRLLISKLTTYVMYVADSNFTVKHPGVEARDVFIRVVCVVPPNEAMTEVQAIKQRTADHPAPWSLRVEFMAHDEFTRRLHAGAVNRRD
jgi:hypothetical protein